MASNDGAFDSIGPVVLIDIVHFGAPQPAIDPTCPHLDRGDLNGDGLGSAVDLVLTIDLVFFDGALPCDPCSCAPYPSQFLLTTIEYGCNSLYARFGTHTEKWAMLDPMKSLQQSSDLTVQSPVDVPDDEHGVKHAARQIQGLLNDSTRTCVAWLGAGLSEGAGYPSWGHTVRKLCDACQVDKLDPTEEVEEKLIDKADECRSANIELYRTTLGNLFGRRIVGTREAYRLLMDIPFRAYLTTNFDPLLALEARRCHKSKIFCYPNLPVSSIGNQDVPHVFYLHGLALRNDAPNGQSLILARSDFNRAYDGILGGFLDQILTYYPIVFIGCSLKERALTRRFLRVRRLQSEIARCNDWTPPKRCILRDEPVMKVHEGENKPASPQQVLKKRLDEEERLSTLGIDTLWYSNDERHSQVEQILEECAAIFSGRMSIEPESGLGEDFPI